MFFETGSSTIDADQVEDLQTVAHQIITVEAPVAIVGHTDNTGATPYNFQLGHDRAASIRDRLIELGVPETLIVTIDSEGESCPIETNSNSQGRAANRRVEIFPPDLTPDCEESTNQGCDEDSYRILNGQADLLELDGQASRCRQIRPESLKTRRPPFLKRSDDEAAGHSVDELKSLRRSTLAHSGSRTDPRRTPV